jgi:O-succinylbenzoic acid--CoA ligase
MDKIENLDSSIFCRRPDVSIELWEKLATDYFKKKDFLYFCSSGSTQSRLKVFEISFQKMLGHARVLNQFFNITANDKWLLSLPHFYMGGLSIMFRAYQNGAAIYSPKDHSIEAIINSCKDHSITHLSLVPRQVHELIKKKLSFPENVKMIFVGGDSLSLTDFESLKNYPPIFYATYGASEVCSQVATSKLNMFNSFEILPWNKVSINETIEVDTPYIFDRVFSVNGSKVIIEKPSGTVFKTNDRGIKDENILTVLGRVDRLIKSSGSFIDLDLLEAELNTIIPKEIDFYLTSTLSDQRGSESVIVSKSLIDKTILQKFNIFNSRIVDQFLYTESGKLRKVYL